MRTLYFLALDALFLCLVVGGASAHAQWDEDDPCDGMPKSKKAGVVDVGLVDFECNEGLFDEGFEDCDFTVATTIEAVCPVKFGELNCELELEVKDTSDLFPQRKTAHGWEVVHFNRAKTDVVYVHGNARVQGLFEPTITVKPASVSCELTF